MEKLAGARDDLTRVPGIDSAMTELEEQIAFAKAHGWREIRLPWGELAFINDHYRVMYLRPDEVRQFEKDAEESRKNHAH